MNSEVTRKNDVYAFATSTSLAKKSVRVCDCQMPIAAKRTPSPTSVATSARGSQAATRRAGDDRESGGEREDEERERDRARAVVPRPQVRDGGEGDERGERGDEEERRGGRLLAAEHPVREGEAGRCEDEVEREEQEGFLVPELDRDPERRGDEERDRGDLRVADERDRAERGDGDADGDEDESARLAEEQAQVVVADERAGEAGGSCGEEAEPGEREEAVAGEEHEQRAGCSEEREDLSCVRVLHGTGRYAFGGSTSSLARLPQRAANVKTGVRHRSVKSRVQRFRANVSTGANALTDWRCGVPGRPSRTCPSRS